MRLLLYIFDVADFVSFVTVFFVSMFWVVVVTRSQLYIFDSADFVSFVTVYFVYMFWVVAITRSPLYSHTALIFTFTGCPTLSCLSVSLPLSLSLIFFFSADESVEPV